MGGVDVIDSISVGGLIVASFIAVFFFGGRRWRSNYEAEHARAERLQATLTEKDHLIGEKDTTIEGQGQRLRRLDDTLQEIGGQRVFELILQMQKENSERYTQAMTEMGALFTRLSERLDRHEERAEARSRATIELFQQLLEGGRS